MNVAKKVASNKAQYDKALRAGLAGINVGERIMIRVGSFTQRMHGRLQRRMKGPYLVTGLKGKVVQFKGEKGETARANVENVRKYKERL